MGFFSWKTADTRESIANIHSKNITRTVYLLQPNGEAPITEIEYDGYGLFDSIDAYVWFAERNAPKRLLDNAKTLEARRGLGIKLSFSHIAYGTPGDIFVLDNDLERILEIDGVSVPAHVHIKAKRIKPIPIAFNYPLKFSFNPDATYESVPASESCDKQGYFY